MSPTLISNPIDFALSTISISVITSMATWKLLSTIRQSIYDPLIDSLLPNHFDEVHITIGNVKLNVGEVVKETMRWIVIMTILFFIYRAVYMNLKRRGK